MSKAKLAVYNNNDQAMIAWQYEKPIANCIGFAIFRKTNQESDAVAEPLPNKVGFAGQTHEPGEQHPSTEWPIQRFTWTDFSVNQGDEVYYKIVPMVMKDNRLVKDEANASDWSGLVKIDTGKDLQAYFNRGIISSQFFNRMSNEFSGQLKTTSVKSIIGGGSNPVRDFLGGYQAKKLFDLLDEIAKDENLSVYAALYELQQNDLIEKLKKIGKRAHVVLSNGSFKAKGEDKNEISREELKHAKVNVYDRIVSPGHFGHNKFLVICEGNTRRDVFTGSLNWTPGGLFSQVNNSVYFKNNTRMAEIYYKQWELLKTAGNSSVDPNLLGQNANAQPDNKLPYVWFSPKAETGDLQEASALMDKAEKGILFLMFNPGPKNTLFNKVLEIQENYPGFFVRGVINQDPGGKNPLILFRNEKTNEANWDDILPDKISQKLGFFDPEKGAGMVTIHSKVIVIDPFTDNGYVITGSNNLGEKASLKNDDNLVIIKDKRLVEEYAVNVLAVYDHYRWRYSLSNADSTFDGLTKDPNWMKDYMSSGRIDDLKNFWFK